jgi:hypothetical protein
MASEETPETANPHMPEKAASVSQPAALERLRDRTDELELIISSLTTVALFSIPGWAFNTFADSYTHLSTSLAIAGTGVTTLVAGFCYGLGTCFVMHLMARAYWVGLIGLRAAFPGGINWKRTPTLGPITRRQHRETLPDLDDIISQTDRLASSIFAVISMLTLTVLWLGTIMVITIVAAGAIGVRFGLTNTFVGLGSLLLFIVFGGVPLLVYLLDAQLAARVAGLRDSRSFAAIVRTLRRIAGIAYPQRLILPVQLTLQSNTRPFAFFIAILLAVVAIVVVGNLRMAGWRNFTLSDEFVYLSNEQVSEGFRSAYYEDMASPKDRLRAWPRVPSFTQRGSFVHLFLPYQPLRDNIPLQQLCGEPHEAYDALACLSRLWSVRIDGQSVDLNSFVPAQRSDLRMRGLMGLIPLSGLEPGLHRIEVKWDPDPEGTGIALDDRYSEISTVYRIPIAFSPDFERALP